MSITNIVLLGTVFVLTSLFGGVCEYSNGACIKKIVSFSALLGLAITIYIGVAARLIEMCINMI